jgi:uncharacterized repeat protein (TIGR01451 family)
MRRLGILVGVLFLLFAGAKVASAGPIIIDGTDSNDHGDFDGTVNIDGWKYMQEALEHLREQVYTGTAKVVVNLGASNVITTGPGNTCDGRTHNAWDAIHSAFDHSALPGLGWTIKDVDGTTISDPNSIPRWLAQLSITNTGILYIPTYTNLCGDLSNTEMGAINSNPTAIINFINGSGADPRRGGALFAMSERGSNNPFGWLVTALPGMAAAGAGPNYETPISLTPDGVVAFPGLTNADLSTGPWHNWFQGNFGSLNILATAESTPGVTRTVILGGGAGTRFGPRQAELIATKVDSIVGGTPGQVALPGDTLAYSVLLTNIDNADVITSVIFTDAPDPNTTLLTGTVATSQGSITHGNGAGHTSITVTVGTIAPGASVTITFRVRIDDPLPAGLNQVSNQGFVNVPGALIRTDDPDTPALSDPTVTPITDLPVLLASKTDRLYTDADNNGIPSAGDTIAYTITVENNGVTATQVAFVDIPGQYTKLITGSVSASAGFITTGNGANDTSVKVTIGTLAGGHTTVVISFRVMIDDSLPTCPTQAHIENQGFVTSAELPTILTDDPDSGAVGDPTVTALCDIPLPQMTKRAVLIGDNDGNGVASQGDELLYEVEIANIGNTAATGVLFRDTPDAHTTLVTGTVNSTGGSVVTGNGAGDTSVLVDVGTVPGGHGTVNISFRVRILFSMEVVTHVSNQGSITSTQQLTTPLLSDDPDTPPVGDPTVTALTAPGLLTASKIGELFGDNDGNLLPSPGDVLLYKVHIFNIGGQVVSDVVYMDSLDPNTKLLVGFVQTSDGTVTTGNTSGDTSVRVDIPGIPAGQFVDITYRATITNPMPVGVLTVTNQGVISSTGGITTTDDPDTPDDTPTIITITVETALQLTAATDVGLCVLPGSQFNVTWTVANVGNVAFGGGVINLVTQGSASAPGTIIVPAVPTSTVQTITTSVSVSQPIPYGAEAITLTGSILTSTYTLPVRICAPDWRTSTASATILPEFVNDQITYTWHISNTGDADANGTTAVFTLPQTLNEAQKFELQYVTYLSSGSIVTSTSVLTWTGTVTQGTGVTVIFHAHISFGFPHQTLESNFQIDHPYRPPFVHSTDIVYPYKLYFMIVLRDSSPVQ